ncbi:MAG: hypothetical protein NC548_56480, partial [Lachnospiraceae bacterium]|nr:hypothetical protein [Lachnospiraceae bacterium]
MGAELIDGSFSSSDWRNTIESLRQKTIKALISIYGESNRINYSGKINTITKWSSVQVKGASIEEIERNFYKLYPEIRDWDIEKWTGIVAEGSTVLGYDIYTPTFERLGNLPFNYSQYVQSGKYSLLEYIPKPEIGTIAYYKG